MNFRMFSKMDQVEQQIHSISNSQQQLTDSVNRQSNEINGILQDFKQEQSWISDIRMQPNTETDSDGQMQLGFEWQVKELPDNAEVDFHYSLGKQDEFEQVSSKQLQDGLFQASFPVEVETRPQWEVTYIGNQHAQEQMQVEEQTDEDRRNHDLRYYVTVSHGETLKSSTIQRSNIEHLRRGGYGVVQVDLNQHQDSYSVHVINHETSTNVMLEDVYVLTYKNGTLVEEQKLEPDSGQPENAPNRTTFYHLNKIEADEDTRFVMKAVYNNGETFEKNVHTP